MSVTLDARTILLLMAFTAVPTSMVLVAVSRFYAASVRGVGYWSGANIALAAGLLILGISGGVPSFAPRVVGNTLLVLTAALYYLAIKRLLDEPAPTRLIWAVVAAAATAFTYLWATDGHYRLAVATLSIALIVLNGLSAARLLRPSADRQNVSHRFTGLLFLVGGTIMAVRLLHVFASDAPPVHLFENNFWHGAILAGAHITVMLMSLGFALMIVDQLMGELNRLATLDALTGIGNRRVFYARAEIELARCRRKGLPLSVLMIDLDRFKSVNDRLGHAAGDETLRRLVALVEPHLREYDFFARLGGEEFSVLLPDAREDVAVGIAERLRELTKAEHLPSPGFPFPTTISIGVAELEYGEDSVDKLLRRADEALYAAKSGGRDRVVAASWLRENSRTLPRPATPQSGASLSAVDILLQPEAE